MARTVVLVAAQLLLLLLLLVMSNRATPALHIRAIGVDVHAEAAGLAKDHGATPAVEYQAIGIDVHAEAAGVMMGHGAVPALECRTIGIDLQYNKKDNADSLPGFCNESLVSSVASPDDTPAQDAGTVNAFRNESLASFVPSPNHDTSAQDAGTVKAFRNESLASFVPSPDHDTSAQDAGTMKVFRNESLASFVPSPDHDTSAQDAGTVKVFRNESLASFVPSPDHDTSALQDAGIVKAISAMFSVVLLWISVGIKWKTPRKVHIVLTALLLASITHYVESVEPAVKPSPPTAVVQFDIKFLEPTFIQSRDELVVKPNCQFEDGHFVMPMEEFVKGGVRPPPRWIRIDSVGESGKQSSVIMRGDTNYLLAFVDEPGLVHFMGLKNSPLFPGAHMLPFGEGYRALLDIEDKEEEDTVECLTKIPLGKMHTEVANSILSGYTSATPVKLVRDALLNYIITLGESQRIKSLGDRLRENWLTETIFLTPDEAKNMLVWSRMSEKWCDEILGGANDNNFNKDLALRGLFSIDAINRTIDLVKRPRTERGRCATKKPKK